MAGFQPRYFELRENDTGSAILSYALTPPATGEEIEVRGSIRMSEAVVAVMPGSSRNFNVTAIGDDSLFARVRCSSEKERQEWITTLELAQGTKMGGTRVSHLAAATASRAESPEHVEPLPDPESSTTSPSASPPPTLDGLRLLDFAKTSPSIETTEGESDDTDGEFEVEHCDSVRRLIVLHATLRKRCESLSAKLATVADGGDAAVFRFDATDFENTYCHLLGTASDVVNKGISWNLRWNDHLRRSAAACEETELQMVSLRREVEQLRVAEAIASPE